MALPKWERAPKTLSVAIHRLEVIRQHVYWIENDLEGSRRHGEQLREEVRHLERILTKRWNANDARLTMDGPCDPDCSICKTVAESRRHEAIRKGEIQP